MVSSLRQLFRRNQGTKQFKKNINDFNRLKMRSRGRAGLAGKTVFPGAGCLPGVGCRLAIVRPAEPKQCRSKLIATRNFRDRSRVILLLDKGWQSWAVTTSLLADLLSESPRERSLHIRPRPPAHPINQGSIGRADAGRNFAKRCHSSATTAVRSRCRRSSCIWSAAAIPRCGRHSNARRGASHHWMKSLHFWISLSAAPHGMIGTVEVEFFGEPSISLSE
jgi:hypothetical protein